MNNQCGNCIHWHKWDRAREDAEAVRTYELIGELPRNFIPTGDCDKIPRDTVFDTEKGYTYDGYSFEDECYDECFHCFEGANYGTDRHVRERRTR